MTQEELEGNKLVAIYMDASITDIPGIQKAIMYPVNGGDSIFVTRLKYHKSMDWLYPVYQKIVGMMDYLTDETVDHYSKMLLVSAFEDCRTSIIYGNTTENLFKEIVEWIKIYNLKVLEDDKT